MGGLRGGLPGWCIIHARKPIRLSDSLFDNLKCTLERVYPTTLATVAKGYCRYCSASGIRNNRQSDRVTLTYKGTQVKTNWQGMRDYFASKVGQFISFAYVNRKGDTVRGFGIVEQVLNAHVLLKTKTVRGYASFDYENMTVLRSQFSYESPLVGEESEEYRVEI